MARLLRYAFQRSCTVFLAVILLTLFVAPVNGQASNGNRAPNAAISLTGGYTQDFDALANTGTGAWTDDSTIAGWYSSRTTYNAGNGSSNTGAVYSFGATASVERSLGSVASGGTGTIQYGARFVNDTGLTNSSLSISYTGEQWRDGGNTTPQTLEFSYQVGATVNNLTSGTWTDFDALDFTGPIATATASQVDGNAAANRTVLSQAMAVTIPAGQEIMLRWSGANDSGNDHGLAIDDLTVSATVLAVTLADFSATAADDHILVAWETASELNNAGFNLYRSATDAAPEELLAFVPSQAPGSQQGASYQWQDWDVAPGDTWWYWLEDIDFNGATSLHGPISATMVGPTVVRLVGMKAAGASVFTIDQIWLVALGVAAAATWVRRRSSDLKKTSS